VDNITKVFSILVLHTFVMWWYTGYKVAATLNITLFIGYFIVIFIFITLELDDSTFIQIFRCFPQKQFLLPHHKVAVPGL
jgi:hypothetical protein